MITPTQLIVDGVRTLLVQEDNGSTTVARYTASEMLDLFSRDELGALALGESVLQPQRHGDLRYTDMVAVTLAHIAVSL